MIFSGRREEEGENTANSIRQSGAECLFVRSDVSSESEVKALMQKAVESYGRIDCAFNNAGNSSCSLTSYAKSAPQLESAS